MTPTKPLADDAPAAPPPEAELRARLLAGDEAAFEALMRRNNRRLYRLARAVLRSDGEAEDALQEAYLAAFRSIGDFRGESSLATWLGRLVLNECLSRQRRQLRRDGLLRIVSLDDEREREAEAMHHAHGEPPDVTTLRSELRSLIERKLDELPAAFRAVFVLRGVEEMSVEETARALDVPEATVRTRYFRARNLLREALAQEIDVAERDVFAFAGARCDRVVAAVLARLRAGGR
jgi:RNA polymerase sigma-70 factor (ECF subfamily)